MKTSIYIPDEKQDLFERAKKDLGDSISSTFVRCLEQELENKRHATGRIIVEVQNEHGSPVRKAFEGRWLVGTAETGVSHDEGQTSTSLATDKRYSVAVTKRRQLVVLIHGESPYPELRIHSSLDDFGGGDYPIGLWSDVQFVLGDVEDLDI